jgi:hypothetical protein
VLLSCHSNYQGTIITPGLEVLKCLSPQVEHFTVLNYSVYFLSDTEEYSKYVHLVHRLYSEYHCGEDFNVYQTPYKHLSVLSLELILVKEIMLIWQSHVW